MCRCGLSRGFLQESSKLFLVTAIRSLCLGECTAGQATNRKTRLVKDYSMAAVDYYLKIEGIPGESQDKKHPNEIHLESGSWGEAQHGTSSHGCGARPGKEQRQDFHLVMKSNT